MSLWRRPCFKIGSFIISHAPKNDGALSLRAIVVGAISLSCEKSLAAKFVEGPECHDDWMMNEMLSLLECSSLHLLNDSNTPTMNHGICQVSAMYYVRQVRALRDTHPDYTYTLSHYVNTHGARICCCMHPVYHIGALFRNVFVNGNARKESNYFALI